MSELLLRQVTQFDTDRTEATLATPTCSSCCCCCCCLGTTVGMSVVAMQDTKRLATKTNRVRASTLAALALPVTAVFWVTVFLAGAPLLSSDLLGNWLILVAILLLPYFFLLLLAYGYTRERQPAGRAFALTVTTGIAILCEAFLGVVLIFTGGGLGPLLYLALASVLAFVLGTHGIKMMRRLDAAK